MTLHDELKILKEVGAPNDAYENTLEYQLKILGIALTRLKKELIITIIFPIAKRIRKRKRDKEAWAILLKRYPTYLEDKKRRKRER